MITNRNNYLWIIGGLIVFKKFFGVFIIVLIHTSTQSFAALQQPTLQQQVASLQKSLASIASDFSHFCQYTPRDTPLKSHLFRYEFCPSKIKTYLQEQQEQLSYYGQLVLACQQHNIASHEYLWNLFGIQQEQPGSIALEFTKTIKKKKPEAITIDDLPQLKKLIQNILKKIEQKFNTNIPMPHIVFTNNLKESSGITLLNGIPKLILNYQNFAYCSNDEIESLLAHEFGHRHTPTPTFGDPKLPFDLFFSAKDIQNLTKQELAFYLRKNELWADCFSVIITQNARALATGLMKQYKSVPLLFNYELTAINKQAPLFDRIHPPILARVAYLVKKFIQN